MLNAEKKGKLLKIKMIKQDKWGKNMKKIEKNYKKSWTDRKKVIIFSVLSIYILLNSICLAEDNSQNKVIEVASGKGEATVMLQKIALLKEEVQRLKQDNLAKERDLKVQREVNAKLKKEFLELENRYKKRVKELSKLSQGVAGALTRKGVEKIGNREARADKVLSFFSKKVYNYVVNSLTLIDDVKKLASDRKVDEVKRASLVLQAESLETQAGEILSISKVITEDVTLKKTRVLKVDKNSNLIVLAGGFNQGFREKMLFKINLNKEKHVTLLIIAVRAYVSAAIVIEGDVKDVTVGDKASSIIENS